MIRLSARAIATFAASAGLLAGLAPDTTVASPATPSPATVQVRVEGSTSTLLELTTVTTGTAPVVKDANNTHSCSGTSAGGALERGTQGNWNGPYYSGLGYSPESIMGESHTFSSGYYWLFWYDHRSSSTGICGQELSSGDDILFFPVCASNCPAGYTYPPVLGLSAPATADAGSPFTVTVTSYSDTTGSDPSGNPAPDGTPSPATNATVTVTPSGATFPTDSHGQANIT
ncbi:MAG TPA: hypothetical protein VGN69_10140, partial [Solirubrobacteraceae bacterium]|nr:hypothetical protein [Solirubrobacteraceae bacterium]